MSISSFCIEQREKEQEALKKFLAISLAGSAVFHVAMGFGVSWLLAKQPEFAADPIEFTLVENPDTEEKPLADTPSPKPKEKEVEPPPKPKAVEPPPKPKAVEPPTPQQPIKTEIPQPPVPQPIVPAVLQKQAFPPMPPAPAAPPRPAAPH